MELLLIVVLFASVLALSYAAFSFFKVKKLDEGTDRMKEIAAAIRTGANAFINYEMKIIVIVALIIAALMALLISWQAGVAFIIGATMSECAGFIGMKIATYANVRVANRARESKNLGSTLKVAFRGGSVMGLCVAGFALLGIVIVYCVFGLGRGQLTDIVENSKEYIGNNSLLGIITGGAYNMQTSFTMTLSGYALGCSVIAMFNRVGGGIYTKAADMGADLVGKTEAHIPEDDPRNPATIADNVGDNVGDVAGLGSDLLESYVSAILASVILAIELFTKSAFDSSMSFGRIPLIEKLAYFPIVLAGIGLIACVIGVATLLIKPKLSDNPHKELNLTTWISAAVSILGAFGLSYLIFHDVSSVAFQQIEFKVTWLSPAIAAVSGIVAGVVIGMIAERYTSADYKHTKRVAAASVEGTALNITQGLALGMRSCVAPCIVLGIAIYASYLVCGMYGVALSALGMLSFVATTVSVDTYGPISDNAGGIAEMSWLDKDVRDITDHLDSVGNTTAAIGKGFAIGSAALAALSMMSSYLFAANPGEYDSWFSNVVDNISLNIIDPLTLAGAIVGAALPFLFSGMLIEAVAKAARKMVEEVRRQFREIKGLLQGEVLPDYKTCIEISSKGAIKEMRVPALMAIAVPVICGFLFGVQFVAGILIGSTLSAIMLAIFTGNAGGAWDNAKKYIETGAIGGHGKGSPAHDAAVVGDTVGDPLKDTVGPCLDIFIKIMSTISLVTVVVFRDNNLVSLIQNLFN